MRDPKRIKRICKLLKMEWEKQPDQRLGQFLINYVFGRVPYDMKDDLTHPWYSSGEHWYWSKQDDETEKRLKNIQIIENKNRRWD